MYILCSPLNHLILYSLHFDHKNGDFCISRYNMFSPRWLDTYCKWPNKRPLPNKRLLSNKRPLYTVKIVLDARL